VKNIAPVITIDGPSGSGKGTVSQLLAKKLAWHYLDSGALYRALAVAAQQDKLEPTAENALAKLAQELQVSFVQNTSEGFRILLDNKDISQAIRSEACSRLASQISALPSVRQALLDKQHCYRKTPGLVTDGRDMGTVIFPDAELKIFLTASAEERAHRRYNQLKEKGISVSLSDILSELIARDKRDSERTIAPLVPASDAIIIDTSHMGIDQVLQVIYMQAQARF
jgi:cytidylate kinase